MNSIRQYRPAYFEGFENETVQFSTLEEMLAIDFVSGFKKRTDFHQFSLSDNHLMVEYQDGFEWWVIGTIEYPDKVGLPKWEVKYKDKK